MAGTQNFKTLVNLSGTGYCPMAHLFQHSGGPFGFHRNKKLLKHLKKYTKFPQELFS
jgi:hypothetical protein